MNTHMRVATRVGVYLMSTFVALVCVAPALRAQQEANVLPAISSWTVAVQPSQVQVTVGAGSITFQELPSSGPGSAVQVDASFQVPQAGRYLLWLDAFWAVPPDSPYPWTWSIPGVGSNGWVQGQSTLAREVAQWVVWMPAGSHTLTMTTSSSGTGDVGAIRRAELRRIEGPVVLPGLTQAANAFGPAISDLNIDSGQSLQSPVYLVFLSSSVAPSPVTWPFGDQWLAAPLFLGQMSTANYTPPVGLLSQLLFDLFLPAPGVLQGWQVLEYDALDIANTIQIGSLTFTGGY